DQSAQLPRRPRAPARGVQPIRAPAARHRRPLHAAREDRKRRPQRSGVVTGATMIGREILFEEQASANYRMRQVQRRRTGEVMWEVIDGASGTTVATGLANRDEALRIIRGWERLSQLLEGGLQGHVLVH